VRKNDAYNNTIIDILTIIISRNVLWV